MAPGTVHPIPVERPFAVQEIFFSTTDRKGVIRSGNRVFTRVSGYAEADLIGAGRPIAADVITRELSRIEAWAQDAAAATRAPGRAA